MLGESHTAASQPRATWLLWIHLEPSYRLIIRLGLVLLRNKKITKKEFDKYLKRDNHRCWHCGLDDDTLIPQHRKNRGHGGLRSLNNPFNVIVLCSRFNGLIEADSDAAQLARDYGWKLSQYEDPEFVPIWDMSEQKWYLLNADFTKAEFIQ